jgi:Holliday junction resolvase
VTLYERGGYYERKTAELFRAEGYRCWQSRGSRGFADVLAIKPGQIVLIQVKSGTKEISGAEWTGLWQLAAELGSVPVVAHWEVRRPVVLTRITGPATARLRSQWPGRPFVLDEIDAAVRRHPAGGVQAAPRSPESWPP